MQRISDRPVIFHEEQAFRQVWLWVVLLSSVAIGIGLFGYGLFQQWILGQPWGSQPLSDPVLLLVSVTVISIPIGIVWLFYRFKLVTEVHDDGLYVRFFPCKGKLIPFQDITRCEARTYSPIWEYGGWGIRYGRNGRAYNVSGNQGVQLEFIKDRPLLIGSQQSAKLAQIINRQRSTQ
ncbi:MAG: DUF6141 family protein [Candidatus Competibacteraceae bacterium]|jgi:hypothetical protein|nr:DUF6141 family protein [Candidatus Competibacteraceae bacterium]